MLRIGIINVTGYIGAEAARLLHGHPEVEVVAVTGRSAAGQRLGDVFPHLAPLGLTVEAELTGDVDAIVSALPHAASAETLAPYVDRGVPVVDLSADFRLRKLEDYERWYGTHPAPQLLASAVFGLPELRRKEIEGAKLIAGPGCHSTAAILALAPAAKLGLIDPDVIVDSKSGISGAGRTLGLKYHFAEANESVAAYALDGHRHLPEIVQELGALSEAPAPRVTFVPHLIPMSRGILITAYATLRREATTADVRELYASFYESSPFVRVVDASPSTKQTLGTNDCLVFPTVDAQSGRLVVISAIDNLMKGGAGQGVQALNIMFGLPEDIGLRSLALYP
ncbi:MAG TPA: N-acetyl-gamma-glutamyl-phosphate reductase [Dehalococcoidia bacterium]|jgi:N-acetyl-gamma-glutamyl-phosphate reductase